MEQKIGWGFIGAGGITNRFINGMAKVPDAYLAAVGSRTEAKARTLAAKYDAAVYTDIKKVVNDKNVDVIYVATPHNLHMEHTIMALESGKPVLCEKPMAPNANSVRKMVSVAREKNIYLMEGMWTRFFPVMHKVRKWLSDGEIGKVHLVTADFGFYANENPASRLFDPNLAGGSLLDVGVYTVAFASMVFGQKPQRISSMAEMTSTGVDGRMCCILGYETGGMASLFSAVRTNSPQEAKIIGEYGNITIPKFWSPDRAVLSKAGKIYEEFINQNESEGFEYEIRAVHSDLRTGRLENLLMPLDESIAIAETMDDIRKQWGLVYPFEK